MLFQSKPVNGELCITAKKDSELSFTLFDLLGKELSWTNVKSHSAGRSSVSFGTMLNNGIYLIKVNGNSDAIQSISVYAK